MANIKIKRKKAPLGAAIPIISTVLSTAGNIFSGLASQNAQAKAIEQQTKLADYQNKLNSLSSSQQTLNGYLNGYGQSDYKIPVPYAKGGKLKGHGGVLVENGGTPHYLGNNTIYYTGRKHKDGGINTNFGGVPANIEGGETSAKLGDNYVIFSDRLHPQGLLGKTPSWWARNYPDDDRVKYFAYNAQEMDKVTKGKTDSGERKAIYDIPPVGRIRAKWGDSIPYRSWRFISSPYKYDFNNGFYKQQTPLDNTTPFKRAMIEGGDAIDPDALVVTGKKVNKNPTTVNLNESRFLPTYTPNVDTTIPSGRKAAYEQKGMYNNWLSRNGLKLYTSDIANAVVGGVAPWFANTIYNKRFEDTDKLFGNLSKAVSNASPIQAAYSGMDTRNPMQWAEYADRIRRGQEERRDFASKLNSQMALQGIVQKSLTEQGIDTNKIFDKYAEQNFNARVKDAELRNQMAAANMESANRFNLGKYQTLAEITRDRTANMDAKYQNNVDAVNASINAFRDLINVGKQQYDYEQQRGLGIWATLAKVTDDKVYDRVAKAIPPRLYDWQNNPYLREWWRRGYNYLDV